MRAASRRESRMARLRAVWAPRRNAASYSLTNRADLTIRGLVDGFDQVAHAVAVDRIAELDLRRDLVALGHRDLAHVVAEAAEFRALPVVPGRRRAGPGADARLHGGVLPIADDHLPVQPHAAHDEPVLAVAVGRLVQVHEIHVDGGPGNVAIVLGVKMEQRLAQQLAGR